MYTTILAPRIKAVWLSCSLDNDLGHGVELEELRSAQVVGAWHRSVWSKELAK